MSKCTVFEMLSSAILIKFYLDWSVYNNKSVFWCFPPGGSNNPWSKWWRSSTERWKAAGWRPDIRGIMDRHTTKHTIIYSFDWISHRFVVFIQISFDQMAFRYSYIIKHNVFANGIALIFIFTNPATNNLYFLTVQLMLCISNFWHYSKIL